MKKQNNITSLYEKDFFKWSQTQVKALKKRNLTLVDYENLIEEIESLGISQKKALYSHLINWLMHMLKWHFQESKRTKSWQRSINNSRREIVSLLKFSPSLKNSLKNLLHEAFEEARKDASKETKLSLGSFPESSPWNINDILE